jgi:excisionase family DNA binding protein
MRSGSVAEMPDEFMTVAEVAAILKLNQQTIRNWIDTGFLPAVRICCRSA